MRLRGLSMGQVGVCRARGEVMESIRKAAEMVIEEVRQIFMLILHESGKSYVIITATLRVLFICIT